MKSLLIRPFRSVLWLLGGAVLLTIPAGPAALEACGESGSCTQLRSSLYASKEIWDACDPALPNPDSQCIFIPGNPKDCTGVLSCEFAVNRKFRADAEMAVYTVGQQSQGCYLCAQPECIAGELGYCEPVSKRCILVSGFSAGGEPIGGLLDSGTLPGSDAGSMGVVTTDQ
jgi:hypothetical protein